MKTQSDKNLVGIAGVYYTAAELTRKGYIALVTSRNTKAYDIVICRPKGNKALGIQVKTSSSCRFRVIHINDTNKMREELNREIKCPFVLVNLKNKNPEFFILSIKEMKALIKEDWESYKKREHHNDIRSKDISMVLARPETMKLLIKYKDRWRTLDNLISKTK